MPEVELNIDEFKFPLSMSDSAVCLYNSELLERFLNKDAYYNALKLAIEIQQTYRIHFEKPLDISDDSIAVEILGHVYFENFVETLSNYIPLNIMDTICEKIQSHCEEINIGEKSVDHNRKFWDLVTPFVKSYFN